MCYIKDFLSLFYMYVCFWLFLISILNVYLSIFCRFPSFLRSYGQIVLVFFNTSLFWFQWIRPCRLIFHSLNAAQNCKRKYFQIGFHSAQWHCLRILGKRSFIVIIFSSSLNCHDNWTLFSNMVFILDGYSKRVAHIFKMNFKSVTVI